ncbi:unnamed protein product, partial [Nesidiocoris tenuis]
AFCPYPTHGRTTENWGLSSPAPPSVLPAPASPAPVPIRPPAGVELFGDSDSAPCGPRPLSSPFPRCFPIRFDLVGEAPGPQVPNI